MSLITKWTHNAESNWLFAKLIWIFDWDSFLSSSSWIFHAQFLTWTERFNTSYTRLLVAFYHLRVSLPLHTLFLCAVWVIFFPAEWHTPQKWNDLKHVFSYNFNATVLLQAWFLHSIFIELIAWSADTLMFSPTGNVILRCKDALCTFSLLLFSYGAKFCRFTYFYIKLIASLLEGCVAL